MAVLLQPITRVTGKAVPIPGADMDTDRIIPARFLKCVTFDELAGKMFYDERFTAEGKSKGHPIDAPQHAGASLMLGGENFGCGSSREHAPQAIKRSGIHAIIAESFAEIFFGNACGIGLPCVCAEGDNLKRVLACVSEYPSALWTLNLLTMNLMCEYENIPVRMPDEPREAFISGRWDTVTELMNATERVEALSRRLPLPTYHSSNYVG